MRPRDILNGLKWGTKDLKAARVTIIHRGAPSDRKLIAGRDILELGRGFMRVFSEGEEVEIPYHRIILIEAGERVRYKKRGY
ncbi:MAG: DUF504 domain-containing protein [Candidatus Hadarchaeota archaeon]